MKPFPDLKSLTVVGILFLASFTSAQAQAPNSPSWTPMELINTLQQSPSGADLLNRALAKIGGRTLSDLLEVISLGDVSVTDTSLYRSFNWSSGEVHYQEQSSVTVNRNLPRGSALLDLAHELVHFVYRQPFNPYEDQFNEEEFIKQTIEFRGGEAHAFMMECLIARELGWKGLEPQDFARCKPYYQADGGVDASKVIGDFYRVGSWFRILAEHFKNAQLMERFPKVSEEKPQFVSAAAGVPYPVAAAMEFKQISKQACENESHRLERLQALYTQNRSPALKDSVNRLTSSLSRRCP